MRNKHKKILYTAAVIIFIIACFKIGSDRKPHFKVIRGNYVQSTNIAQENRKININSATLDELDKLEGVGPAIAERIIEYRIEKPFRSIDEIMNVKGIGIKKYENIKEYITIE